MRSYAEIQEFVKECVRIENDGGDVQEYIRVNWPSYSPRATWYNLQRQYLGRNKDHFTEGRPRQLPTKRKEESEMRKGKTSQADTAQAVINCLESRGNLRDCLSGLGFANVSSALRNVKAWVRKNRPEYTMLINKARLGPDKTRQEPDPAPAEEKPVENQAEEQKAPETVILCGKTYEKMEKAEQKPQKPVQNTGDHISAKEFRETLKLTQKAPEGEARMAVFDEINVWKSPLPVCAVKSRVKGEWHLSNVKGCVHLIWEDLITKEERSIGLPAEDWLKLAEEIPLMLMQLGLAK